MTHGRKSAQEKIPEEGYPICSLAHSFLLGRTCFGRRTGKKYPDRPINMVVPWGQGGAGDLGIKVVAEEKRLDGLADVPTFIECGYPIVISPRYSFCFPKGTPKEIVATFSQAQDKAFKKYAKEIKDGLRRVEIWADFLSYEDTVQYYKKQYEFLYKLSEELGFLAK